ncbi:Hypothetical predicted protein, partial [Pelobates cultripes]
MGVPDVWAYHRAALLAQAINLNAPKGILNWIDLEQQQMHGDSLLAYMWTPALLRGTQPPLSLTTLASVSAWDALLKACESTGKYHKLSPLGALSTVSPWLSLKRWVAHGVTSISQFISGGSLIPFAELQQKYNLPSKFTFLYLQIKSVLMNHVDYTITNTTREMTGVANLIATGWNRPLKPKLLSLYYKSHFDDRDRTQFPFAAQWERKTGQQTSMDQW